MQVSVEKTSELSRKMTVCVPEDVVQEKVTARLKSLARTVKIDGFRPGKVPQHVVNKMYGDRVRDEITGDLIQSTYFEALQNQDLKPAGYPHIQPSDETEGFKYVAEFEVYPEISLEGIEQVEVTRPVSSVETADVDAMIESLREQKQTWVPVERESQEKDRLTLNFSGTSEGENFTEGKVEGFQVEIGQKKMIPGFEDNLIGLKAGENKTFTVTFPEEYGNEKLAGKEAEFEIEVVTVEAPSLPELDEDFFNMYGVEEGTMEAFREGIKANMETELEQALYNKLKSSVMDAIYEKVQIQVPNALIDQEVESLMKPYIETAKRQKLKPEDLKLPRDMFEEQAKRRVALGLILGEMIHQFDIKLDDAKVRSTIEDMARSYERPEDVINWYYSDKDRLHDVQQMVLENQAIDWLVERANVKDKAISFSEAMNKDKEGM